MDKIRNEYIKGQHRWDGLEKNTTGKTKGIKRKDEGHTY